MNGIRWRLRLLERAGGSKKRFLVLGWTCSVGTGHSLYEIGGCGLGGRYKWSLVGCVYGRKRLDCYVFVRRRLFCGLT